MSYLSKSKKTSVSSGVAAKSCTTGRAVLLVGGVVVVPPPLGVVLPPLGCAGWTLDGVAAVLVAAPVGAAERQVGSLRIAGGHLRGIQGRSAAGCTRLRATRPPARTGTRPADG